MSRSRFYLIFFLVAPIFYFLLKPFHVGDLAIWTAIGRDSIDQLRLIKEDIYTVGPTKEMIYPALASLFYGLLFKIQGLELVAFVHALVPSIWVLIWYRTLCRSNYGRSLRDPWTKEVLFVLTAALLGTTLYFVPRQALLATIPLLLGYNILKRYENERLPKSTLLGFVIIEILWTNIHGTFLLFPILILFESGRYFIGGNLNLWKNRLLAAGAVLLSILVNPFGWKIFPYVFETIQLSKARGLNEWSPPQEFYFSFASWYFFIFSAVFALYLLWLVIKKSEKINNIIFDPIILVWMLGFMAVRNVFLIFLFLPTFTIIRLNPRINLEKSKPSDEAFSKVINSAVLLVLITFVVFLSPFLKERWSKYLPSEYQRTFDERSQSQQIDYFLRNNEGLVFNTWIYGSDLALQQKNRYFIDTRNVIFPDETVRQYDLFMAKPETGSADILKYNFKYFVVSEKDVNLVNWLKKSELFSEKIHDDPMYLFEYKDNRL